MPPKPNRVAESEMREERGCLKNQQGERSGMCHRTKDRERGDVLGEVKRDRTEKTTYSAQKETTSKRGEKGTDYHRGK